MAVPKLNPTKPQGILNHNSGEVPILQHLFPGFLQRRIGKHSPLVLEPARPAALIDAVPNTLMAKFSPWEPPECLGFDFFGLGAKWGAVMHSACPWPLRLPCASPVAPAGGFGGTVAPGHGGLGLARLGAGLSLAGSDRWICREVPRGALAPRTNGEGNQAAELLAFLPATLAEASHSLHLQKPAASLAV